MSHLSTTRPAAPRFWVIGGEYTCLEFEQLVEGSEKVAGPFFHKSAAEAVWRRLSEADRSPGAGALRHRHRARPRRLSTARAVLRRGA